MLQVAGLASVLVMLACAPGSEPSGAKPLLLGSTAQAQVVADGGVAPGVADGGVAPGVADGGVAPGVALADAGASDAGASADAAPSTDAAPPGPLNDCCTLSTVNGGCSDPVVTECVCALDAQCCDAFYDSFCATLAVTSCGQQCEDRPPVSDCCTERDVPGCTDPVVQDCVCQVDAFCCIFPFDQTCVNIGVTSCGADCGP